MDEAEAIERALLDADFAAGLELALKAWRRVRHPKLADLVGLVATKVVPPPAHTLDKRGHPSVFQKAWLALASHGDPRSLGRLLDALRHGLPTRSDLPEDEVGRRAAMWAARVDALATFKDDPRIAAALAQALDDAYLEPGCAPVLTLLGRLADERTLGALRRLVARGPLQSPEVRAHCLATAGPIIDAMTAAAAARPAIDAPPLQTLERCTTLVAQDLRDHVRFPHGPEGELLAMVLAAPDDDAPRQIYADALLEAGDPRGDFIAIQFKLARGEASDSDVLHLRELYRTHEPDWLGDLSRVLKSRVYRAGFLERAALCRVGSDEEARAMWDRAANDARLGTIRVLEPGHATAADYQRFAFSPAMKNLREVAVLSSSMFERICSAGEAWGFSALVFHIPVDLAMLGHLTAARSLPALREVAFFGAASSATGTAATIHALEGWAERSRLDAISLALAHEPARSGFESLPLWITAGKKLAPVARLGVWLPMSRTYVRRLHRGRAIEIEVRDDLMLAELLSALSDKDIEEVVIRPPPREACCNLDNPRHLVAALRRLGAKRVVLPARWEATVARGY